jgi:hypothetical protein
MAYERTPSGAAALRCRRAPHPNNGRSGLRIVRCGGQPAQDVVRVSDMDGERNISAPRGQQFAHMLPFRGGCVLG